MIWIIGGFAVLLAIGNLFLWDANKCLKELMCKRCKKKRVAFEAVADRDWEDDGYSM